MANFVPYETVLKLEKKGYKGKTIRYYGHIYDVLKWLREEKKIHICIDIWKKDINDTSFNWGYDIVNLITTRVVGCDTSCANTYELAAIAGIKYCLDNLI